jgi:hypothetical protein
MNLAGYRLKVNIVMTISGASGQRVLVMTVPKFCQTGTVAIVNLRTLQAYPMVFKSEIEEESMDTQSPDVDK